METFEILPTKSHSATLICLHGLGDSGENLANFIRFLLGRYLYVADHVKIIFPKAPDNPYSPLKNKVLASWFDANGTIMSMDLPDNKRSFEATDRLMADLIQKEVDLGIPMSRIIVGGYSMGAIYALHVAYRTHLQIGAVFALSPYMAYDSAVYDSLELNQSTKSQTPPQLLMMHGEDDDVVQYKWCSYMHRELTRLGVPIDFQTLKGIRHEIRMSELLKVEQWARELLPPLATDLFSKL